MLVHIIEVKGAFKSLMASNDGVFLQPDLMNSLVRKDTTVGMFLVDILWIGALMLKV